jgi:hypothetical protein
MEGESLDPILTRPVGQTEAMKAIGMNTLQPHDELFTKKKKLGQGGFGTVWLCESSKGKVRDASREPWRELLDKRALRVLGRPDFNKRQQSAYPCVAVG